VVLLSEVADAADAGFLAERILAALEMPYAISEPNVLLSASVGISIYPQDGHDADALIKSADAAMYQAKGKGNNNYHFFKQNTDVRGVERQFLESSLGGALEPRAGNLGCVRSSFGAHRGIRSACTPSAR
jgi:predicted signal transduction protein with EAL and GGDEF domain